MHTYRSLFMLLVILAMAPVYAAPINPKDWEVIAKEELPEGDCFKFSDGKLIAIGNTNGKELFYKVTEETPLMKNGSGLSITLQFNNETFLSVPQSEFHIIFHNDNSVKDGGGEDFFHIIRMGNYGGLNIYDAPTSFDETHILSENTVTTIKVDYFIKENHLHYSYTLNDVVSEEYMLKDTEVNPDLAWRPCFGLRHTDLEYGHSYTVTDVTFIPASVPEPTTATLSLLALAGLAVKRRRK